MIFSIIILLIVLSSSIYFENRCNKLKKRADLINENINTLHQNQVVLMSMFKQLHQQIRLNERQTKKDKKEISRQIRILPTGEHGKTKGIEPV